MADFLRGRKHVLTTKDENGSYHSFDDNPAIICEDGTKAWLLHGKFRRDEGPVLTFEETSDSSIREIWAVCGNFDEKGRPAMRLIFFDGRIECYLNGVLNSIGGNPAVIDNNGNQFWYKDGKLDRAGGLPTIVYSDGKRDWHEEGVLVSSTDFTRIRLARQRFQKSQW